MLDAYEAEYEEQRRDKEKHAHELDQLRNANRSLSTQVYVNWSHNHMKVICRLCLKLLMGIVNN